MYLSYLPNAKNHFVFKFRITARARVDRRPFHPMCVRRILSIFRADAQTIETEKSRYSTRQPKLALFDVIAGEDIECY